MKNVLFATKEYSELTGKIIALLDFNHLPVERFLLESIIPNVLRENNVEGYTGTTTDLVILPQEQSVITLFDDIKHEFDEAKRSSWVRTVSGNGSSEIFKFDTDNFDMIRHCLGLSMESFVQLKVHYKHDARKFLNEFGREYDKFHAKKEAASTVSSLVRKTVDHLVERAELGFAA